MGTLLVRVFDPKQLPYFHNMLPPPSHIHFLFLGHMFIRIKTVLHVRKFPSLYMNICSFLVDSHHDLLVRCMLHIDESARATNPDLR